MQFTHFFFMAWKKGKSSSIFTFSPQTTFSRSSFSRTTKFLDVQKKDIGAICLYWHINTKMCYSEIFITESAKWIYKLSAYGFYVASVWKRTVPELPLWPALQGLSRTLQPDCLDAPYCLWWVWRDRKYHNIVMPNERKWWYFCALSLFCKNL